MSIKVSIFVINSIFFVFFVAMIQSVMVGVHQPKFGDLVFFLPGVLLSLVCFHGLIYRKKSGDYSFLSLVLYSVFVFLSKRVGEVGSLQAVDYYIALSGLVIFYFVFKGLKDEGS
ncbi:MULTISPECIES: hypothetical protein [unclassified Pseudoalteromonas]|uniref:hypothetical protein n=1 Tax=unclassified Pseudoalteromonas TaxID=194690 RepID=UPI001F1A4202|nr:MULTISPECIES: hypothetical protein [unclassified Pseudoalteromonas]MCF2828713.1 hypothetical protein [Pseudoalteromonas sp. OF5H-5]MCF2834479.1 hypothetical protein [Pseudoalteromonas sp. DL2-H6]MCF2925115.1 hypothetical protein [Pseudoalteromonas sp. DL2-H1]